MDPLHRYLEALYRRTDGRARRDHDPVRYAHRYADPADQEIAALLAVSLAYGRVDLFFPVLDALFAWLDAHGGPRRAVAGFEVARADGLRPLVYRWNRGSDFVVLLAALRELLGATGRVEDLFDAEGDLRARLTSAVDTLRTACAEVGRRGGLLDEGPLPRGLRYLLPSPAGGSACKRWNLYLRWMVRPPREQVDLGLWSTIDPADLVMPVDVHVGRLSRFLGLTDRQDASWRTAEAITDRLRGFDPADPVRFDFALAHLGISRACRGHRDDAVCPACPLHGACRAAREDGPR